jgi:hypothetical protein
MRHADGAHIAKCLPVSVFHYKAAIEFLDDQGCGKWRSGMAGS